MAPVSLEENSDRQNLASLVDDFDRRHSDVAVVAQRGLRETKTSYRELASLARRFAQELIQRKIVKGERVLLWGENNAEWVGTFFGCVLRGVLPVPLDSAGSQEFAHRVASEVSPRLIVGSRDKLQAITFDTPSLNFEELFEVLPFKQAQAIPDLSPNDALQIIFTSGTTGEPKGIVHTHGNVLASLAPIEHEMQRYLKYERPFHPIRFLHTLPLSHVFGQFMGLWIPPLLGAEVHYRNRLVASELAEQIRTKKISVVAAVPRVLDLLQAYVSGMFPRLAARSPSGTKTESLAALVAVSCYTPAARLEILGLHLRRRIVVPIGRTVLERARLRRRARLRNDGDDGARQPEPSVSSRTGHHWAGAAWAGSKAE